MLLKLVFVLALIVALVQSSIAQVKRVMLEPRGGFSISTLYSARSPFVVGDFQKTPQIEFSWGVNVGLKLTDKLTVVAGYSADTRGAEAEYHHDKITMTRFGPQIEQEDHFISVQNTYHNIPLFVRYNTVATGSWNLEVEAGGFFSILKSSEIRGEGSIFYDPTVGNYNLGSPCSASGPYKGNCWYSFYANTQDFTNTSSYDYGALLGIYLSRPLAKNLSLFLNPQFLIGLRRLDSKYTDDVLVAVGTHSVTSFYMDYHNLSSFSKQLNFNVYLGAAFSIR